MKLSWLQWLLPITIVWGGVPLTESSMPQPTLEVFLNELFAARTQLLMNHNMESIGHYYLDTTKSSKYAYEHEKNRSRYLQAWAIHRGVKITKAENKIRIKRKFQQLDTAKISLVNTTQITYHYPGLEPASQQFGLGTHHGMKLKKIMGQWHVYSEWYSDPLDEDPELISVHEDYTRLAMTDVVQAAHIKYNRIRAVAYADKYAGSALWAEKEHKYNNKYKDYSYLGGDCTNFASQVIGDSAEGGGLPMTSNWYYRNKYGGSQAWVRTDSFKGFLIYRGYGRIIAKGGFKQLHSPSSRFPNGAFASLSLGDLIAYEMKGDVDHFCILTGRDPKGYPLVNSHSSDRYHVPLDLGWDKNTKFILIHMQE